MDIAKMNKISVSISHESDVMIASVSAMRMAKIMGMSVVESTLCATAVSELATNIIRYAHHGEILLHAKQDVLNIIAQDCGPGISNIEQAMQDGYSEGPSLGMGLSGVARIMDSIDITTNPKDGTTVMVSKRIMRRTPQNPQEVRYAT